MANCQLNSLSPTLGRYYVWISLDNTPSRARIVHRLYVCYNPATSWFEIVELPVSDPNLPGIPKGTQGHKGNNAHTHHQQPYFDKTSATVGMLVNRTWLCRYPCSQYIVYDNRSELQLHFKSLCDT